MADDLGHLTEQIKSVANDNKRVSEESVTSFKQAANDNTQSMANFAKDLNSYFSKQKNDLQNLTDAIETSVTETENVARKIDNTNQLLQNSINIQRQMLGELTSVSGTLNDLLTEEKGKKEGGNSLLGDAVSSLGALGATEALKKIGGRLMAGAAAGLAVELAPVLAVGATVIAGLAAITAIGYFIYYKLTQSQEELEALKRQERENAKNKGMGGNTADNPKSESPNKYRDNEFWTGKNYTLDDKGNNVPETNQKNETGSISKISLNHKSNGTYSASSAAQLASQAGATPEEAKTLGAIAMAESSGNPNSHNTKDRDNSYGLWQINLYGKLAGRVKEFGLQSPDDLFDPQNNAKAAVKILRQQGFNAWSKYSNGEYKKYLNQVGDITSSSPFSVTPKTTGSTATGGYKPTATNQTHPELYNGQNPQQGAIQVSNSQITNSEISKNDGSGDLNFRSGVDKNINKGIADKVKQIEGMFGNLTITSGYRSPEHNSKVGGAKNSAHMRGNAVDVSFGGGEQATLKLIEAASKAGIGGIGVYRPGVVHLDTESRRAWGPNYHFDSVPGFAKKAIQAHLAGKWGEYDASAKSDKKEGEQEGGNSTVSNDSSQKISDGGAQQVAGTGFQGAPAMFASMIGGSFGGGRGAALGAGIGGIASLLLGELSGPRAPGPIPQPKMAAAQPSTPTQMVAAPSINPKSQSAINREGIPEHTKNSSPDWAHEIAGLAPRFATHYSQIS